MKELGTRVELAQFIRERLPRPRFASCLQRQGPDRGGQLDKSAAEAIDLGECCSDRLACPRCSAELHHSALLFEGFVDP